MIRVTFGLAERQDVRMVLIAPQPLRALDDIRHMPGVLAAEPFRLVPARLTNGTRSKRLAIEGRPTETRLSHSLSPDLRPMAMPKDGLVISEALAAALPVVSTDCSYFLRETLIDPRLGRLARKRDPQVLAQAIIAQMAEAPAPQDLLEETVRPSRYGTAAQAYLALFESLLGKRSA